MLIEKLFGKKPVIASEAAKPGLVIPDAIKDALFLAQPPHIQRFLGVMNQIACDVVALGAILKRGGPVPLRDGAGPIWCRDIEALFERRGADGKKTFLTYSYTQDLKVMDPNAQIHLSQFFGRIIALNTVLTGPRQGSLGGGLGGQSPVVAAMLDQILLQALFFKGVFSAYDLSTALLLRRISGDAAGQAFQLLIDRTKADFAGASPYLFDADRAFAGLPVTTQQLLIEVAKPYEEGQKLINGVYFDAEMGAQMLAHAAKGTTA